LSSIVFSLFSSGEHIVDNGNFTMSRYNIAGLGGNFANSNVGMVVFGTVIGGAGPSLTGGNCYLIMCLFYIGIR
jgi:hypothetical protein